MKRIAAAVFSVVAGLCVLLGAAAQALPIAVHNTGVDATDAVVAPGAATAFWTLTSQPAGSALPAGTPFRYRAGPYYADTASSAWVSPTANGNAGVQGEYIYTLTIDLTGFDPASAVITGEFGTDNDGRIFLNGGGAVAVSGFAAFFSPIPFTIDSGFVDGINEIHLGFNNAGDPSAFRVDFKSADARAVPEPGTLALLGLALAAMGGARRSERI